MKVKICGCMLPEEASYAASLGADYIGINFVSYSKRYVTVEKGREIVLAAREGGAEPVGVFVDEAWDEIVSICEVTGLKSVQLHGKKSRAALPFLLTKYAIIYAIPHDFKQALPEEVFLLFDGSQPGGGRPFSWDSFIPPRGRHWILAGGLNPGNVAAAIRQLTPFCVDVASGVERPGSLRKDPVLIKAFIEEAKR